MVILFYKDPTNSLHEVVHLCKTATEQLDQQVLNNLMLEVEDALKQVDNPSMKEVKGIEDRLYGLDQILSGARKIVQEQSDLAQVSNMCLTICENVQLKCVSIHVEINQFCAQHPPPPPIYSIINFYSS
jgi:hypothetical protein